MYRRNSIKLKSHTVEPLENRVLLAGDLVAHWLGHDLTANFSEGDTVTAWTDRVGNVTALVEGLGAPKLLSASVGGRAAVHFDASDGADRLMVQGNENPMHEAGDFTIAVVFATSANDLRSDGDNWFDSTGLVDGNRLGFAKDYGVSINSQGQILAGISDGLFQPTTTIVSETSGLNDGQTHTVFFTRSSTDISLYVDDAIAVSHAANNAPRDANIDLAIGGLLSSNGPFTGDIAEVRIYNGALDANEVATVRSEITTFYNNSAPIAEHDTYTGQEDSIFGLAVSAADGVLRNDTDADGDSLTAQLVSEPSNGTLAFQENGSFLYFPEKDFFGTDSFTYSAFDFRPSNVATVTLNITSQYDPVETSADSFKAMPTQVLHVSAEQGLLVNDANPDRAELKAILAADVAQGQLTLDLDGSFTYDPQGFSGVTTFTYQVDDGTNLTAPETVVLIVNTPPTANDDELHVDEDISLVLSAANGIVGNDVDADGNALTVELVADVANGTLELRNDGSLTYTPNPDFFGNDRFTYRLSDSVDPSNIATATIAVAAVNDAPVAEPDAYFGVVDEAIQVNAGKGILSNDSDVDNAVITAKIVAQPSNGTVTLNANGSFHYMPTAGFEGTDTFQYQADDGSLLSDATEVSLFVGGSPLRISEIMVANVDGVETRVRQEPGDNFRGDRLHPDWIEIQNLSSSDLDISGFHLSDDRFEKSKWAFPEGTTIPASGYFVVYATRLNISDVRLDENGVLHTNFVMNIGGEYLGIADPSGNTLFELAGGFPQQYPNTSYGFTSDGNLNHLVEPTLAADNVGGYAGIVSDTKFSVDRGYFTESFEVEITTRTEEAQIRYTFDGSHPSPETGFTYEGPITIDRTTTLRAAAFRDGYLTPNVDTQTYLFLDQVIQQSSEPTVGPSSNPISFPDRWRSQRSDYEMDTEITDSDLYRDQMQDALRGLPSLSLTLPPEDLFDTRGLYANPGSTTEKAASAELFFADGTAGFQMDAGARMQGGASRNPEHLKHSMSLRFREDYGHSELDYALFEDSSVSQFDSIHLRARYNNSWIHWSQEQRNRASMIREMWMRETMLAAGEEAAGHGRYVHLYLNGLYWGVYEMHERQDASHYAAYFGGASTDYAATNANTVVDGTRDSFQNLSSVVRGGDWEQIQQVLDIDNHILFNIVQRYGGNQDLKADGNWRAAGGGIANAPWQFYMWDVERVLENPSTNRTQPIADLLNFVRTLDDIEEYVVMFGDHIHRVMYNDGALTPEATAERWMTLADQLDTPIIAESARWGDARPDRGQRRPLTKHQDWLPEQQRLINSYFPVRTANVIRNYRRDGLYPDTDAPEFLVNGERQHGGPLSDGQVLSVLNPNAGTPGTIYFTTDNSDPRAEGGAVGATANVYDGQQIPLNASALVKMRILRDGEWSALSEASFTVETLAASNNLRITEINYHPHNPFTEFGEPDQADSEFEFIEVGNVSNVAINLAGVEFKQVAVDGNREGISFVFDAQILAPGERTVVVRNREVFVQTHGDEALAHGNDGILGPPGQWSGGRLSDGGETVTLVAANGDPIHQVTYNDRGTFPTRADGDGSTLEIMDPFADPNDGRNWVASKIIGGTPGFVDVSIAPKIVINELLSNSDAPTVDQIEFLNMEQTAVDISGWYLSDSNNNLTKYRFEAGVSVAANSYLTLDQNVFGFGFSGQANDDAWFVQAADSGIPSVFIDAVAFSGSDAGVSFGRWPNGTGALFPMSETTFGSENSGPVQPNVIISEFNYNPMINGDVMPDDLEFVEIWNTSGGPVDISGWRLNKAINFEFAANTTLGAGQGIVVVPFALDQQSLVRQFRTYYGIDAEVPLVGPFSGVFDNGGENLEWERPVPNDNTEFILVDRVRYDDDPPWPLAADGQGESLNRVAAAAFGNVVSSWTASTPSPGSFPLEDVAGDFDGNGIVNASDIHLFCANRNDNDPQYDLDGNNQNGDDADFQFLIQNILGTNLGDSNLDGIFNSRDLIEVFIAGEYEDGIAANSNWSEGDWNCDGEFDTGDLVAAFGAGAYRREAVAWNDVAAALWLPINDISSDNDDIHEQQNANDKNAPKKELHLRAVDALFDVS